MEYGNTKEIFMDIDHYPSKYGVSAYTREEILNGQRLKSDHLNESQKVTYLPFIQD